MKALSRIKVHWAFQFRFILAIRTDKVHKSIATFDSPPAPACTSTKRADVFAVLPKQKGS